MNTDYEQSNIDAINKNRNVSAIKNARNTIGFLGQSTIYINNKGNLEILKNSNQKYSDIQKSTIKNASKWHNIVSFIVFGHNSFTFEHITALKGDGTVVSSVEYYNLNKSMDKNKQIVAISGASPQYLIALKRNGTVEAYNDGNRYGQCEVNDWRDIISISTSRTHTVGLKSDGTVVSTCEIGQYPSHKYKLLTDEFWEIIKEKGLTQSALTAAGLTMFGKYGIDTAEAFFKDTFDYIKNNNISNMDDFDKNQFLKRGLDNLPEDYCVDNWKDIISVKAGDEFTVALNSKGQLIASGNINEIRLNKILSWKNLSDFYIWKRDIYGITQDGKVLSTNEKMENDCSKLTDIREIFPYVEKIIAIKKDNCIISNINETSLNNMAIKFNGESFEELLDFEAKNTILIEEKLEEEKKQQAELRRQKRLQKKQEEKERKRKEQIITTYKSRGVCQYCGGTFKGLFKKKCSQCGRNKDY